MNDIQIKKQTKEIYGVMGEKGHGKDTFSALVKKHNDEFTILHFADDLKHMCKLIFGLTDYQLHDRVGKEELFPEVALDTYIDAMRELTGLDIQPRGLSAISSRQIMQFFGTDYVRHVKDTYWIDLVLDKINTIGGKILIPDTRYPNEAEALRTIGGEIIKIVRVGGVEKDGNSSHASETEMAKINPDHIFSFREGELSKMEVVAAQTAFGKIDVVGTQCDPRVRLNALVSSFNYAFEYWQQEFEWGANILPSYRKDGTKYFSVVDLAPIPSRKPTPEQIEKHKETLEAATVEQAHRSPV